MVDFPSLGITKSYLQSALSYFHFTTPSPVQTQSIPLILSRKNLMIQGKNGTGKTLAFTCSVLQLLDEADYRTQVVILSPTREIAAQTFDFFNEMTYSSPHPVYTSLSCGGYNLRDNVKGLLKGCQVVIGTPGRVLDLIKKKTLKLDKVQIVVLDEADALITILNLKDLCLLLPPNCQILAFSATYTAGSKSTLTHFVPEVQEIQADNGDTRLPNLIEYHLLSSEADKTQHLLSLLRTIPFHQAIVFYNTKSRGELLSLELRAAGFPCLFVSGDMPQEQRIEAIRALRFFGIRVLLSTDLSSRGIDVLNVNLTVNYDLPMSKAVYTHRIGRAGRYNTPGIAVTLVSSPQVPLLASYSPTLAFSEFHPVPLNPLLPQEEELLQAMKETSNCDLCRMQIGKHCHCQTCMGNYRHLAAYLDK